MAVEVPPEDPTGSGQLASVSASEEKGSERSHSSGSSSEKSSRSNKSIRENQVAPTDMQDLRPELKLAVGTVKKDVSIPSIPEGSTPLERRQSLSASNSNTSFQDLKKRRASAVAANFLTGSSFGPDSVVTKKDQIGDLPKYTAEEVAKHDKATDCWVILNSKVYDVTLFLKQHPGGSAPLLKKGGKDATQAFNMVGHSSSAISLIEKFHIGTCNASWDEDIPEFIPSSWHESRRLAMLRGRHGKLIEQWMGERDWLGPFLAILCAASSVAVGLFFGMWDPQCNYLWVVVIAAFTYGIWMQQAVHHFIHEYSHDNLILRVDTWVGDIWKLILGSSCFSDLALYYGPFHKRHHKFLGCDGRLSMFANLAGPAPVSEYPEAEMTMRIDLDMEIEGYFNETPNFLGSDQQLEEVDFQPPFPPCMRKIAYHNVFNFVICHTFIQCLRRVLRELVVAPIQLILYTVKSIKHVINISIKTPEQLKKSKKFYNMFERELALTYWAHFGMQFFYLTIFHFVLVDWYTTGCSTPVPANMTEPARILKFQMETCDTVAGQHRVWREDADFWENFRNLNWNMWWYFWILAGAGMRQAPIFSIVAPFWCADHAGYGHESADKTMVANTCQRTRSFYGWMSWIVMFGMNYHCEHHDHPRIPYYRLRQLRKIYPEFYDNLKYYDWYPQALIDFLKVKGRGWKYAMCD